MDIQHDHAFTVDELLDELHKAESKLTAVRAVVNSGEPDWRRRCENAAAALRGLLSLPDERPGSWEAEPVGKLDEPLRDVLALLDGADR
jgi:hypothetical protein